MKKYDVIIIGAGPAGLLTAINLMKTELSICILEKEKYIGKKNVCGGACDLSLIEKYDIKMESMKSIKNIEIVNYKKRYYFKISPIAVFNREELDRALFDKVRNSKNIQYYLNSKVIDFFNKNDSIIVKTKNERFKCKYLIIASGPLSSFLENKNIGFSIRKNKFAYGGRILVNEKKALNKLIFDFSGNLFGYKWIFENKKETNIGNGMYVKQKINLRENLKFFCNKFNYSFSEPYSGAIIPLEFSENFTYNNIVCIGDAAGMVNPVTAGGLRSIFYFSEILSQSIISSIKKNVDLEKIYKKKVKNSLTYFWLKLFSKIIKGNNRNILFFSFILQFFILQLIYIIKRK